MTSDSMRGVFPILVTPFDEKGRIDEDSLANLVDFNIAAGVHGLGVAIGSEMFKFNEAERKQVTRCVVEATGQRVPVVINTGAGGTDLAVHYSRAAEEAGADALMIMPPAFLPAGQAEVRAYFRAISDAVGIPIFLQDTPAAPISPGLANRLVEECEQVRYIKVETLPVPAKVVDMVNAADGRLVVFGGAGGDYFIEELRRGSLGTMPFCSQPAAFVEVWDRFREGDERGAWATFDRWIAPVNRLAAQGGDVFYHVHKRILVRLGVIRTATVRGPTAPVDGVTAGEVDALLDDLYPSDRS
ncbi:MAG: dihydrodipicolinate synthase family protein [Hyphomicrobiales bacterium]|nr:dihydrodipicolinate synthase family protein [Hyphomicrobiales bacterium]